jgi:hypothetical protein
MRQLQWFFVQNGSLINNSYKHINMKSTIFKKLFRRFGKTETHPVEPSSPADPAETIPETTPAEPPLTDKFGNPCKIYDTEDRPCKVTFPKGGKFEFLGDEYSLGVLRNGEEVKVYYREKYSEAILKRDRYGRLFLYFYDEYTGFDEDRYDHLWTLVADEADADEFVHVYRLSRLRKPYVAYDGGRWTGVHEWL